MHELIGPRSRSRVTGLVLLGTSLTACTSWHLQQAPPAQVVAQKHPERVRVTRADGSQVVVHRPTVRADTVFGSTKTDGTEESLRVPVYQIRALEIPGGDAGATFGLLFLASAVSLGTYLLLCDCISNP